jgi:hypothetical protein
MSWSQIVTINPKKKGMKEGETKDKVRKVIDPKDVGASTMKPTAAGGVKFKCNRGNNNILAEEIKKKMRANFEVKFADERKPSVKIIGLFDDKNSTAEQLEMSIRNQNEKTINTEDYIKIEKIINSEKNRFMKTIIAETKITAYKKLLEAKKIIISWSRCTVLNAVSVMRCYNCSRYSPTCPVIVV